MLHIQNFSKSYNDQLIVRIDQLTLQKGVCWIKGDNGSGKTTLFKCLGGLLPFQGEISFDDGISATRDFVGYRKRVHYSEAEPLFPGFLTARDLIKFVGKIRGASEDQQHESLKLFGVDQFLESPCETYSSGMAKKLGLTLALLGNPEVLILDEPLITLDHQTREVLYSILRKKLEEGILLIISSHHSITANDLQVQQTFLITGKTLVLQ